MEYGICVGFSIMYGEEWGMQRSVATCYHGFPQFERLKIFDHPPSIVYTWYNYTYGKWKEKVNNVSIKCKLYVNN